MRSALELVQSYEADITRAAEVVTSKEARGPSGVGFQASLCRAGQARAKLSVAATSASMMPGSLIE